jgi:hypothetical protein
MEWIRNGELTLEPIMTLIVSTLSWQLGRWVTPNLPSRIHIPIFVGAISFHGVYSYATAYWMQGVDLTAFNGWTDFWTYIAAMRMAMPIPLLTIEYAIHWLGLPGVWSIGYLAIIVRIGMITGMVWALAPLLCGTTWRQVGASIIMVGLLAGTTFVFRYDDRNVWMVYDALFAAPLIWLWRTLQRTTWESITHWICHRVARCPQTVYAPVYASTCGHRCLACMAHDRTARVTVSFGATYHHHRVACLSHHCARTSIVEQSYRV